LKWSHPFKRRTGDPDVKVVTASVQIDDFDVGIWHYFEHLCFEPFRTDHDHTNASSSLNMCLRGFLKKIKLGRFIQSTVRCIEPT